MNAKDRQDEKAKEVHVARLYAWRKMKEKAEEAVKLLEDKINKRWPGAI